MAAKNIPKMASGKLKTSSTSKNKRLKQIPVQVKTKYQNRKHLCGQIKTNLDPLNETKTKLKR